MTQQQEQPSLELPLTQESKEAVKSTLSDFLTGKTFTYIFKDVEEKKMPGCRLHPDVAIDESSNRSKPMLIVVFDDGTATPLFIGTTVMKVYQNRIVFEDRADNTTDTFLLE